MNKTLKNTLEQLSQDQLIQVIEQVHSSHKDYQAIVEQAIAAYNPKELYKLTNKAITGIKNGTRFISYRETYDFEQTLDRINAGIEKLITEAPDLAIKLCQRLIDIDGSICERVDDSNGFLSACYATTYHLLDRAFVAAKSDREVVGRYLYEVYKHDEYGLRGYILENAKQSLRAGADKVLETLLQDNPLEDYKSCHVLKIIADVRGDVDTYIELVKQEALAFGRPLADQSICEIATRLNAAFRSEEAIHWLDKISEDGHYTTQKTQLLIEAYQLEGKDNKARQLLWERFERYLHVEDYLAYLKQATESARETAKINAIALAKKHTNLNSALAFLADIQQWDEVDALIIDHAKADTLGGIHYSHYRKLSTRLAKQERSLAATLLRRALVEDVLYKAQSKYYHYAVSDLKKAHDFAQTVSDWQGFTSHPAFIQALQTQHARKHAFWSKLDSSG
ncbi:MAG: hypothetical protein ACI9NY_002081 [Kiritimatiellia bacterium]|jgi:hypothetical protein